MREPDVEIAAIRTGERLSDSITRVALQNLPADEQERIRRYHRWDQAQKTLLATLLARRLLGRRLGRPGESLRIRRDPFGRPYLDGEPHWEGDFSISHSGSWVVCAVVDRGRIGIDVQQVRPVNEGIFTLCLSSTEREKLLQWPVGTQLHGFFTLWTLKEAFVKALGQGLSYPLTDIQFDALALRRGRVVRIETGDPLQAGWYFQRVRA